MTGHPLRPATRRSLGRPLPHQQADRPRAHPPPTKVSTTIRCLKWSYPVLDPVSEAYPRVKGRLLTCYSPVRRSCTPEGALPLDLHVLSTPPAFVLSQDQTLHRKLETQQTTNPSFRQNHMNCRKTNPNQKQVKAYKLIRRLSNTLLSSQTKGGDPAAPSGTATLLRLRPNRQPHLRPLPPQGLGRGLRVLPTFVT